MFALAYKRWSEGADGKIKNGENMEKCQPLHDI